MKNGRKRSNKENEESTDNAAKLSKKKTPMDQFVETVLQKKKFPECVDFLQGELKGKFALSKEAEKNRLKIDINETMMRKLNCMMRENGFLKRQNLSRIEELDKKQKIKRRLLAFNQKNGTKINTLREELVSLEAELSHIEHTLDENRLDGLVTKKEIIDKLEPPETFTVTFEEMETDKSEIEKVSKGDARTSIFTANMRGMLQLVDEDEMSETKKTYGMPDIF